MRVTNQDMHKNKNRPLSLQVAVAALDAALEALAARKR